MLRSDLCDYNDAYTAVKGTITVNADNDNDENNNIRSLAFKNNEPFISSISKINVVLVENSEDLDVIMPMYNLSEYYSKTSGSLWNYYRDELTDEAKDGNGPNKDVINSKSYKV